MRYSVKEKIKASIRRSTRPVFLRPDFSRFGEYRQVSRALQALESEGLIVRAGYGVYNRPEHGATPDQLLAAVTSRLGRRVNRLVTFGNSTLHLSATARRRPNAQTRLDQRKLQTARTVLQSAALPVIRQTSLDTLRRWKANGVWCSAYTEWEQLMVNATDAEIVDVMTSTDEDANRLRQSPPYIGLLPQPLAG